MTLLDGLKKFFSHEEHLERIKKRTEIEQARADLLEQQAKTAISKRKILDARRVERGPQGPN